MPDYSIYAEISGIYGVGEDKLFLSRKIVDCEGCPV